jgi:predicted Zn-dependent protease
MDEQENRLWNWLERNAAGRRVLAVRSWWERRYYHHVDRYHQASQGIYRFCTRAVVIAILALGTASAFFVIRPYYRHYQEYRGEREARVYLTRGDYRNAQLCARQALQINPSSVPACRVMAEIADQAHSPQVLIWEERIVAVQPTTENKLMLAAAGLRYQKPPFPLAAQILTQLSATATNNTTYQLLAASLALGSVRLADAESHFAAAAQLDPQNQNDALNLAIVRLGMTNEAQQILSRATLEKLSSDPNWGPGALRALTADRLANNDLPAANKYSTQLLATGKASLPDQLQNLGILHQQTNHAFSARLADLQQQAGTNALAVTEVSSWMLGHDLTAENLQWLISLPDAMRAQQPVELALANAYLSRSDWRGLRDFASEENWNNLEFFRFALVSHACAEMDMTGLAVVNWGAAVNEAETSYEESVQLVELADRWQMTREREELLKGMVDRFPKERWPAAALTQLYFSEGKTAEISQLSDKLALLFPGENIFKNNQAATALLLKTNLAQAFRWAASAYTNSPKNPDEVTTYAYALHLQHRDRDGLALLEQLPSAKLKEPTVALYYGLLLVANGKHDEALSWLEIARTNRHLLPEEKQLLASALGQ